MKRTVVAVCLAALIVGCQKSPGERTSSSPTTAEMIGTRLVLGDAVVGRPPRIASILAPVDLTFNAPVVPPHSVGTVLDKSPFSFTPVVAGTVQWISQTVARFTPEKPLAAGMVYKVVFHGKTAFGSQRNVDDYSFEFKTAEQEVVEFHPDFLPDTSGRNMVRFSGTAVFAQPVNAAKVSKDLKCAAGDYLT